MTRTKELLVHLLLLAGTATDSFQFDSFSSFRNRQRRRLPCLVPPSPATTTAAGSRAAEDLLTTYNPVLHRQYFQRRPWLVAGRALSTALPFLSWYTMTRFDNLTSSWRSSDAETALQRRRGRQLREAVCASGSVTFVKYGQAIALRGDVLKKSEWTEELVKLVDEVGTFDDHLAMRIIADELAVADAEVLFAFENGGRAVASASIGQVYQARLRRSVMTTSSSSSSSSSTSSSLSSSLGDKDSGGHGSRRWSAGTLVAVKVQRPDALSSAALDIFLLRCAGKALKRAKGLRSDLAAIVDELAYQLFQELDYRQEAKNAARFSALYGHIDDIFVPEACQGQPLTGRRVLTMEWCDGQKGPWPGAEGERLLAVGLKCSVLQVLRSGYFHADPHLGNLLRTADGRLAYLDFGMMTCVPPATRFGLVALILGLQNRDLPLIAEQLCALGFLPTNAERRSLTSPTMGSLSQPEMPSAVLPALEAAYRDATGGSGEAASLNFTRFQGNLNAMSDVLPFRTPPFFALIVRTLAIYEGLAKCVRPDFTLLTGALPWVVAQVLNQARDDPDFQRLLKRVLVDEATGRVSWSALTGLLSIAGLAEAPPAPSFDGPPASSSISPSGKGIAPPEPNVEDSGAAAAVNPEMAELILDFVFSADGQFLRTALVDEVAATVEDTALAAQALASILTGGILVPRPAERADEQRLTTAWRLLVSLVGESGASTATRGHGSTGTAASRILGLGEGLVKLLMDPERERLRWQADILLREITVRLLTKQTRSLFQSQDVPPSTLDLATPPRGVFPSLAGTSARQR